MVDDETALVDVSIETDLGAHAISGQPREEWAHVCLVHFLALSRAHVPID